MKLASPLLAVLALVVLAPFAPADEGMWLYSSPPQKALQERYQFTPPVGWLEHLQKASVRFPSGSGSFVSADGLVMTNQHVAREALVKLGSKERNIVRDGFYAKTRAEELKCLDMELLVLQSIEDVTERVKAAVKPGLSFADAEKARRAVMSTIEKESLDKTGLRSDVVTLYQGGQYHLYRYKKYTDIRLVWAPEADAAHFGGDPDNFEYPRYCLDATFFRVYENDKPAKVEHFLKWSDKGAGDGELVFVSGHPGRTSRLNTVAHLELFRDQTYPMMLNLWRRLEVTLKTYSDRNPENARKATGDLLRVQNARKLFVGMLAGLQDPQVMETKRSEEKAIREAIAQDAKLKEQYGDAWGQVEETVKAQRKLYVPYFLLESSGRGLVTGRAFNSQLYGIARALVRYADEKEKPNAERLREFRESNLESLKQQLFSPAAIYEDFEIVKLADSLAMMVEMVGANNDVVQRIMDGKSPQARASELVRGTKLRDVKARQALFEGGRAAVEASDDPMIRFARLVDIPARRVRKMYEEQVEEPQQQAYAKIANALFALKGKDQYPDATFTLRLAFGTVKGYTEDGKTVAPWTTLGGAFKHAEEHAHKEPFILPKSWQGAKDRLKLETPYNFVCTADIIGGNSGSPVVNRKGELVGLIFDGNIQSLTGDFQYTETQARAVAVHSAGIVEALRGVYGAAGGGEGGGGLCTRGGASPAPGGRGGPTRPYPGSIGEGAVWPIVQYLIACDDVQTDPSSLLRLNVLGLITNIRATGTPPFPVMRPMLCVLLVMTRCQGTADLSLRIINNATGQIVFQNPPRRVRFVGDPQEAIGVTFRIRNCVFPVAGLYWIEVVYSQTVLARRPLFLL